MGKGEATEGTADNMKCYSRKGRFGFLCIVGVIFILYQIFGPSRTVQQQQHIQYIDHHKAIHHVKVRTTIAPPVLTQAPTQMVPTVQHIQKEGCFIQTENVGIYKECNIINATVAQEFVAIGCAITTRNINTADVSSLGQTLPFFRTLLSTVCRSISKGWMYRFYLAYDEFDPLFMREDGMEIFKKAYNEVKQVLCPEWSEVELKMVHCSHTGRPAWAQNDAMMAAYLDNATYYFRVNDDTSISTKGWTEQFVNTLKSYDPPNIGVVGPLHKGGNEFILTQDFVHRTHIDIFGFYYPRIFHDWWADDWMTDVYQPSRMTKLDSVKAVHTYEKGTRYNHSDIDSVSFLHNRVKSDQVVLQRYIDYVKANHHSTRDPKKIISMSLYNRDIKYTYGAIRNALLQPLIFPEWTLRIYLERPGTNRYPAVPVSVVNKLRYHGVQLYYIDSTELEVPPMMWRFLVADDETVTWFIVRDSDSRLTERDASLVKQWLAEGASLHCIRDHPSQVSDPLYGGLWGAKPSDLHAVIKTPLTFLMKGFGADYGQDIYLLSYTLWPRVRDVAFCHDSISCHRYVNSHAINITRKGSEHIGQVFDAYGEPRQVDIDILVHTDQKDFCIESPREEMPKIRQDDVEDLAIEEEMIVSPSKFNNVVIWTVNYDGTAVLDVRYILESMGATFIDLSFDDSCSKTKNCAYDLTSLGSKEDFFNLDNDVKTKFYDHYKDQPIFKNITHFLCVQPVAMCELYMSFNKAPYNKSIITLSKDRYEYGRENATRWLQLNRNLLRMSWERRNTIAANNHYDLEYMRYFLGSGMPLQYIPSHCGYVNASYEPSRDGFLVMPISPTEFEEWFITSLNKSMTKNRIKVHIHKTKTLYKDGPSYHDIAAHAGVIHVPDQISLSTICEHYQMNIPLFIPTLGLLSKWHLDYGILNRRTLNSRRNSTKSSIEGLSKSVDPNDSHSEKALKYWLRYSDFYQWPYVLAYDSIDHLIYLLSTTKLNIISTKMKAFNRKLKKQVTTKWIEVLETTLRAQ